MKAFTLVELLVVISIISVLLAIVVPALSGARRQARTLLGMRNQREVTNAVNLFAADNDDLYPPTVATVGSGDRWNWVDPTKLTGFEKRSPRLHRSMSAYLHDYIPDAKTVFCPSAPQEYKYLQECWDAGDDWDNPDTPVSGGGDPVGGTYCFYWGYLGYIGEGPRFFRGPLTPASMGRQSRLLVSDYFGYDDWRSPEAFGSCEKLNGADVVPETQLLPAYWALEGDPRIAMPEVKLRAGYTDGHVETYSPSDTVPMRVPLAPEGVPPWPDGALRSIFYIPRDALH